MSLDTQHGRGTWTKTPPLRSLTPAERKAGRERRQRLQEEYDQVPESTKEQHHQMIEKMDDQKKLAARYYFDHLENFAPDRHAHMLKNNERYDGRIGPLTRFYWIGRSLALNLASQKNGYYLGSWSPKSLGGDTPNPKQVLDYFLHAQNAAQAALDLVAFEAPFSDGYMELGPKTSHDHRRAMARGLSTIRYFLQAALEDYERYQKFQKEKRTRKERDQHKKDHKEAEDALKQAA